MKGDESEFKKKKEEDKRENAEKKQKMAALKEACERCIALHTEFFENMKPEQISRIIKKNIKQTYNILARGKESLRIAYERTAK